MKSFQLFSLAVVIFNCFIFNVLAQNDVDFDLYETDVDDTFTEIETPTQTPPPPPPATVATTEPTANVDAPPVIVTVYLYNAYRNKCLRTSGLPNSTVSYGDCDNSDNILWIIPDSHYGNYRSKANPDYCLSMNDGMVALKPCEETTTLYRTGNFIKSPFSYGQCVGSLDADPTVINASECNASDPDQIWYYNLWTPTNQIEEVPEDTVTLYLYNAYKNKCLHTSGTSVFTEDCDFSDASLWVVPNSHQGHYRSKAFPDSCLAIIDGKVTMAECNKDAVLFRDVNFIKSPNFINQCIGSRLDNSIAYIDECNVNDPDQIWYFNIYTPPAVTEVEAPVTTEVEAPVTTEVVEVPTTTVEEKITTTITSTVTAVMTEAI